MKKLLLISLALFIFVSVNAQATFGISAGLHSLSVKYDLSYEELSGTESESGVLAGVFVEFPISDKLDLRPSLLYSSIEDYGSLMIPIMAKYMVADKFFIQAGPQINYLLDEIKYEGEEASKLAIQIGLGGIYQITENIDINLRYGFGVSSFKVDGEYNGENWEDTYTPNSLTITLGYKIK